MLSINEQHENGSTQAYCNIYLSPQQKKIQNKGYLVEWASDFQKTPRKKQVQTYCKTGKNNVPQCNPALKHHINSPCLCSETSVQICGISQLHLRYCSIILH